MTYADWKPAPVLEAHLEREPPAFLHHYTTQKGLLGILQSRELWASNIYYLNDHQEFTHGMGLFRNHIIKRLQAEGTQQHFAAMLERIDTLFPQYPFYVACWSEEDDDLAQWRAYSRGGTGYAISMNGDVLHRLAKNQDFIFASCEYRPDVHAQWVEQIIEVSLKEMVDDEKNGVRYERAAPGDKLLYRLMRFSPLMKHPSFAAEKEWRLIPAFPIVEQSERFGLHQGRSSLIPHFPFRLEIKEEIPLALTQIRVGPCAEPGLAQRAVMAALFRYGQGNNRGNNSVATSAVPYRDQL